MEKYSKEEDIKTTCPELKFMLQTGGFFKLIQFVVHSFDDRFKCK